MSTRGARWAAATCGVLAPLTLLGLGAAAPGQEAQAAQQGPAAPETRSCTEVAADDPRVGPWAGPSRALAATGVLEAQDLLRRRGVTPGAGVVVAVVDSGIADAARLPAAPGVAAYGQGGAVVDPHGTIVAGLVAAPPRPGGGGAVGVAPGARLVDVRVLDAFSPQEGQAGPLAVRVAEGLEHVLAEVRRAGGGEPAVDVVNVSMAVPPEPRIDAAVEALWREGVVVVAESGDRPVDESDPLPDDLAVATPGRTPRRRCTRRGRGATGRSRAATCSPSARSPRPTARAAPPTSCCAAARSTSPRPRPAGSRSVSTAARAASTRCRPRGRPPRSPGWWRC
nr:S8 family serine peptidase [Nocardioides marinisabuli]